MNNYEQNYEKKIAHFIGKLISLMFVDERSHKTAIDEKKNKASSGGLFIDTILVFSACTVWIAKNQNILDAFSNQNQEISPISAAVMGIWLCSFVILYVIMFKWVKKSFRKTQEIYTQSKNNLYKKLEKSPPGIFFDSIQNIGYSFGKRVFLLPALPTIEKEIEQLDYAHFSTTVLPPIAYENHNLCKEVMHRYPKAGIILSLSILGHSFTTIIIIFFAVLMTIGIVRLVFFSFFLSLLGMVLGLLIGVIGFLISRSFWNGVSAPFKERANAWAQCEYEHRLRNKVTDIANEVDKTIAESLDSKIAILRVLYADEVNKTEIAIQKRQEAMEQLKRIASQRDIAPQTLDDFVGLLEYILDQRLQEERRIEEQLDKRNFLRERLADFIIGIIFFLLGMAVAK